MHTIHIYTDGSCRGNPGPGGYGVVIKYNHYTKELSQGYRQTTNNRMELLGIIIALEALKVTGQEVIVYSDSRYVVNAVEKGWLSHWVKIGFKGKKNPDLWQRFWKVYARNHIRFCWIKGHNGHQENERCDALAIASSYQNLLIDFYYESIAPSS